MWRLSLHQHNRSDAMTLTQLIEASNLQVDDTYDNIQYYKWFQEMLDDITPKLFYPRREVIARDPITGSYPIPLGFKSVITVQSNSLTLARVSIGAATSTGYYIMVDQIYVVGSTPATITLFYDSSPNRIVESPDYTPDIPILYHSMFVTFACKQAMLLEDEVAYEDRYRAYLNEYEKSKKQMEDASNKERSNTMLNSATRWVVER